MLVYEETGKLEYMEEKALGVKDTTNNKLNPHMALMPGFEPMPFWKSLIELIESKGYF